MKSTKRVFVVVLALVLTVALAAIPASALTMVSKSGSGTIPGPEGGPDIEWGTFLSASKYGGAIATVSASRNTLVYAKVEAYLTDDDGMVYVNTDQDLVSGTSTSAFVNNVPQEKPELGSLPMVLAFGDYTVNATVLPQLRVSTEE